MTYQQKPTWIGLKVEDCLIDEMVAEGSFSWIYAGNTTSGGTSRRKAFKWAKHAEFLERIGDDFREITQAKGFFTGGMRNIRPQAEKLLAWQVKKVSSVHDPALVPVELLVQKEGLSYCQMPFISGPTLREAMLQGPVSIDVFITLTEALNRLSKLESFQYHGDVKPDNIILSPSSGLKLIDPGYFGPMESVEGDFLNAAITTTCYYPYLKPDDLFALGICMWEAACRFHPLLRDKSMPNERYDADGSLISRIDLADSIKRLATLYEGVGNFCLQPLLHLRRPRLLNGAVSAELEQFLLKAVRLSLDDQERLDVGPGFASFDELLAALHDLRKNGVNAF